MKKNSFLLALVVILASFGFSVNGQSNISLSGAGSTFVMPFYNMAFQKYTSYTQVKLTYGGIGSGGGIRSLKDKVVDFGASDAFLSDEQMAAMPAPVVEIPTCSGAVVLAFNLPGIHVIKLTPQALTDIYMGKITNWSSPELKKLNPGVNFPNLAVTVVYRSEGSGTTNIFTNYLSKVSPEWKNQIGFGTTVKWPVGIGAKGNPGVAGTVSQTVGAIGYVGSEYAFAEKISYALMQNKSGKFIKPSIASIGAAGKGKMPQDTRVMITNSSDVNAYPIAGDMNGWVPHEMTKVSVQQYTITISDATTSQQYKYCSGPSVINYIEKASTGYDITNRSYQAADVVQQWASVWIPGSATTITVGSGSANSYFFHSDIIDSRNIEVWLPDGYSTSKKYSVLYMHDGQMLFNPSITWNQEAWKVDETLGSLLSQGLIQNTIVVGIDNNGTKRESEYFPQAVVSNIPDPEKTDLMSLMLGGTIADNYLKFIATELKPYIDMNYSTYTDQQHTFIGGSSLGGLITLYALCSYPDVFSNGFCMSTHWIGTFYQNTQIPAAIINYLSTNLPSPSDHKIYFDHGTIGLDSMYAPSQVRVDSLMKAKGYTSSNFESLVFQGADHNENSWSTRFSIPATFILTNNSSLAVTTTKTDDFIIYPNPVQNELFIKQYDLIGKCVKIFDINGKQAFSRELSENKIDTSHLMPGIYFVVFNKTTVKVIKN